MSRISIISFFCCLFCFRGVSQAVTESLEQSTRLSKDTALFNQYLQNSIHLGDSHPDSSHYYAQKAYSLALNIQYSKGLAEYFHFLTAAHNEHSHYDSAMQTARVELYWARKSKDVVALAWAYNAIANVFEYMGDLDSSANYFVRALHISNSSNKTKLSGTLNYNLASVLYLAGDYQQALAYARKGYHIGKMRNDTHTMSNSLIDIGSIQVGLKNYDTALACFERVINMVRHTPDSLTILDALNDEGDVYAKRKQYRRSLAKYRKLLSLAQRSGDPYYLLYAYGNLGITLLQTAQLQDAETDLNQAIQISRKIHARNEMQQFYEALSEVKEKQKQFVEALAYRKKYDSLKDTLMNESAKKNMHLLEVKYETAQKNKKIAGQQLELSVRQNAIEKKNTLIGLIAGGLIALAVIFMLSRRSYRHRQRLQQQKLLTLQKQHEVNTLKTKMDAREEERNRIGREIHDDVGSALTTILYLSDDLKSKTGTNGKQTAERIADTAGSVVDKMNEIIWSMNREYDTLDDLIAYTRQHAAEFLDNYKLAYRFETPDPVPDIHLQGEQRRNIYLVIKETLHNVVKHACATEVNISFHLNDCLAVIIHDNGKGINTGGLRRFGNGLRNMKQRMESIGGSFDIINEEGTTVKLQCPLERNDT